MKLIFFVYLLISIMSSAMGKSVDICRLPKVTGFCMAQIHRFAYSPFTKRCFPFVYGGCGGNANNFVSMQACESACKGK